MLMSHFEVTWRSVFALVGLLTLTIFEFLLTEQLQVLWRTFQHFRDSFNNTPVNYQNKTLTI